MSVNTHDFSGKKKVSVVSVIEVIVIIILVLMIIGMITCNVMFRKDNNATNVLGYSFYKTRAVNMVPEIPVNTVIVAKKSEIQNIKQNSVILCNIGEYISLTRVVEIQQEDGKSYYVVKFDTSPANETFRVSEDAVIAKAIWQLESFGKFLDFATSVPGIIIAVIIPLSVIIIIQLVRIKNIRELEREASSIDDIDDMIFSRDKEKPAAVTFTQPKFSEDITDRLPVIKSRSGVQPADNFDFDTDDSRPKAKLTVDNKGMAAYSVTNEKAEHKAVSPLFTYDRLTGKAAEPAKQSTTEKQYAMAGSTSSSREDVYINRPTRIEATPKADEIISAYAPKKSLNISDDREEKVVFTPHLSNIIPESIAAIQEEAAAPAAKSSAFDESVKAYYDKSEPVKAAETDITSTIPEKAVVPKETIAPVKKKKSSKTLEELMSIIDAEETKLKK